MLMFPSLFSFNNQKQSTDMMPIPVKVRCQLTNYYHYDTEGALCFICKEDIENTDHFLLDCPQFKENFDSIWRNLDRKVMRSNPTDGIQIADFIKGLNCQHKVLLVGGLSLPFGKIYKVRTKSLRELEAPFAPRAYVKWRHRG